MTRGAFSKGLFVCHAWNLTTHPLETICPCARCGATLHGRIPNSIARGWAFLAAAAILYIPANLLPILHTGAVFGQDRSDTIMRGVVHLWETGSPGAAPTAYIPANAGPAPQRCSRSYLLS